MPKHAAKSVRGKTAQRLVLAFYQDDASHSRELASALRKSALGEVAAYLADGARIGRDVAADYARLRLDTECLIAVACASEKVAAVVQILRRVETRAVVVLHTGVPRSNDRPEPFGPTPPLAIVLRDTGRRFEDACADLAEAARLDHTLTAAAEWILDNAYIVRQQIAEVRANLPHGKYANLPPERHAYLAQIARDLIATHDCAVDADSIAEALRGAESLSIAELWLLPLILRLELIHTLADLAWRAGRSQQLRELAYLWADRLSAVSRRGSLRNGAAGNGSSRDADQSTGNNGAATQNGASQNDAVRNDAFAEALAQLERDPAAAQPYFAISLAEQLNDNEPVLAPVEAWIERRLGSPLSGMVHDEHIREAADRVSTANAVGSLRTLAHISFPAIFEAVSAVEAELRRDPAGIYPRSDFATRDQSRHQVERIARQSGWSEIAVARKAIELATQAEETEHRHVAYYLLADGVTQLEIATGARLRFQTEMLRAVKRHPVPIYIGGILAVTAAFTALAIALARDIGAREPLHLIVLGALSIFPLSELATQIVNAMVISMLPPSRLAKMDFESGIPPEYATLVVIPMLFTSRDVVREEVEKLEVRFLANQDANLYYALFPDFTDADDPTTPADDALVETAKSGIGELNARYPGNRFLLFYRRREWSASEQRWIGRERKRGKLEDLNAFLCGYGKAAILSAGELPVSIRYVITLDSDTQLPPSTARRMVETIAHPLNRVVVDEKTRTRRAGFAIIQPRISVSLPQATATRFTRVFSSSAGTDPYCETVSDAQMDLLGEAIFHGKAIYDVKAFCTVLQDRFPPETLLSHDLIEGAHAGVGLATDIELFENVPHTYASFARREHRWIRGDWQIARWMLGRVPAADAEREPNPLSGLNRWRICDNLRRSLVPVAVMLLLLFGWLISATPGVWTLVVTLAVAIPALAPLLERSARRLAGTINAWHGAADELVRAVVMLAFLPHQAWLSANAVGRVFYRKWISHRHLLEWETAEAARAKVRAHMDRTFHELLTISGLSGLLVLVLYGRSVFAPTFALVALWLASPALMLILDQPASLPGFLRWSRDDTAFLRRRARRIWRFFDDLVNDASNWLPPDNQQLALRAEIAQRTSPTNIGLWIGSAIAAHDFGYLTSDELLRRLSRTFQTFEKLERYDGHLLNWYDTRTLQPLAPRYVSTVDSGNFLGVLWMLEQACRDITRAPIFGSTCFRGLTDTLGLLRETCEHDVTIAVPIRQLRHLLHAGSETQGLIGRLRLSASSSNQILESKRWTVPAAAKPIADPAGIKPGESPAPDHDAPSARRAVAGDECSYWAARLHFEIGAWTATVDRYLGWTETLTRPPDSFLRVLGEEAVDHRRAALAGVPSIATLASEGVPAVDAILGFHGAPELRPEIAQWLDQLSEEYRQARESAAKTLEDIERLAGSARTLATSINMRFLYDARRRLFAIGYAVGEPLEFHTHYDLLASECRLASLVAIAKGDAPVEHWAALGRPRGRTAQGPALLSWSGTMFEYLMPGLLMRAYSESLLDRACRDAVAVQIRYGESEGVPWGISECAYSALDALKTYQYRAFGVPALALKRGREEDLVVAPYAAFLALPLAPKETIANLERLEKLGLGGPMGLYESIDFTRERKREGDRGVVVYTYMAHHQGMSLVALNNALHQNVMQRRFHRDARIRAFESLLFERVPLVNPRVKPEPEEAPVPLAAREEPDESIWKEDTSVPRVHMSGNGKYHVMLTNSGAGFSRWRDFDVTRWRSDAALDPWGSFLYLRDVRMRRIWSAALQPVGAAMGSSAVSFSADRAQFRRRVLQIESVVDIAVAPEDDVELRRVVVTNRSLRSRQIELTSYLELALAPHAADAAHPAFAKMFVETEYAGDGVLIAHRRLRAPDDPGVWVAHMLVGTTAGLQHETDRERFLGRGRTAENAEALDRDLTGTTGAVIDPIFSLRGRVTLEARESAEIVFATMAAPSREELLVLVDKYKRLDATTRAFEMIWTHAQLELRYLGIRSVAARRFQELAGQLLYPNPQLRPSPARLAKNRLGQSSLWAHGISGSLPMLAVTVADERGLALVRELLLAHAYWRLIGFRADIIILDQESAGYDRPLRQQIQRHIDAHALHGAGGSVFLLDAASLPREQVELILASAGVVLNGLRGSLQQQLASVIDDTAPSDFAPSGTAREEPSPPLPFLELPYFNGLGGFTADGREYAIYLGPGAKTPMPWANIIANPRFGALITESGLGCAWNGNSQSNRLTPWHNDPISDPQSEIIYLRDEESGAVWTPTALPIREQDAYRARHGQGYTIFEHNSHAISQELTVFVPVDPRGAGEMKAQGVSDRDSRAAGDPAKIYRLRLRNDSSHKRRLRVTYFAEWVLGATREEQQWHIHTGRDESSGALIAYESWKGESGRESSRVAFAASSPRAASYSCDRAQFLGRNGSRARPAAMRRVSLDNRSGTGADPAAALQIPVELERGASVEIIFLLGQASNLDEARAIVGRYSTPDQVTRSLDQMRAWWDSIDGALEVKTPLLSADFLLNRWLVYQALACRFWARTAFYQSSGAFGYRDQLQDSMAFLYAAPRLARGHILAAASRQFVEGDVQHWWHAETGLGVRTRCSDDMLWLPYVVAQYVSVTGDAAILDENVAFIEGAPLAEHEQQRMFIPAISAQSAPLWEHCKRALDRAWKLGAHGLPLIGLCDWNDGLDRVGEQGRGESVWLGWFLSATLNAFADVMEHRAEADREVAQFVKQARDRAAQLPRAVEKSAWDGDWYLRAFFDDGSPLGSHANTEARIDSLAQSWAAISGAGDPERVHRALASANRLLVDEPNRMVKLLAPPFDHSTPHPGYIMGYPPGVRENGGQYTHGSLWLAMAYARMGNGEEAVRLLQLMNPVEANRDEAGVAKFRGEPYVCPADISADPDRAGRCGWTWYTGSAAWMYRVWIEEVLGFKLRGDELTMEPSIPRDWPGFEVKYRYRSATYKIRVERYDGAESRAVIGLVDDGGTHEVVVRVSGRRPVAVEKEAQAEQKPELIPQA